jgi:hypothetical protein
VAGKKNRAGHLLYYEERKWVVSNEMQRHLAAVPKDVTAMETAASVPSSFTSTAALWNTSSTHNFMSWPDLSTM